jgi:hypothetical protein
MARYYDWSPAGYSTDPIPGDPQVLRDEAAKFKSVAESITEAATNLRNIADHQDATGEFVEEFSKQADEVADRIIKAEIKYTGLADALREYAGPLEQFQADSVTILNRAINANANAKDGAKWEQHWTKELLQPDVTPDQAEDIQKKLDAATRDRMDGESGAIFARQELEQLGFDRDTAANAAADKIKQAGEDSGINDSGWDNWVQFWEENGEWIDAVVDIIGTVAGILAVVALFIPGLNVIVAVIGVIVIAATVLSVANAVAQASAGTKSVASAVIDVGMALLPLGVGKVAGKITGKLGGAALARGADIAADARVADSVVDGVATITREAAVISVADDLADVVPSLAGRAVSGQPELLAQLEKLRGIVGAAGQPGLVDDTVESSMWILKDYPVLAPFVQEPALKFLEDKMQEGIAEADKTFIKSEMSW